MTKILYFTAGPVPTTEEKADIDALNLLTGEKYTVGVRNGLIPPLFGAGAEACDYVAGTPPLTGDGEAYEDTPVFDPDSAGEGFAPVTNGMELVLEGDGTYVFTVVDGAITAIDYTAEV